RAWRPTSAWCTSAPLAAPAGTSAPSMAAPATPAGLRACARGSEPLGTGQGRGPALLPPFPALRVQPLHRGDHGLVGRLQRIQVLRVALAPIYVQRESQQVEPVAQLVQQQIFAVGLAHGAVALAVEGSRGGLQVPRNGRGQPRMMRAPA